MAATKTPSWAIYARMSLDRTGEGLGVERQLAECRKLGKRLKLPGQPTVYIDNDVSATSKKPRPQWQKLLADLGAGRHDTLVCWHTDRLYRKLRDLVDLIEIAERRALRIASVQATDIDLSTPAGRMLAGMLGHAARYEVEQKGLRRRLSAEQHANRGGRNGGGMRSFGYGQNAKCPGRTKCKRAAEGKPHLHSSDLCKINRKEAAAIRSAVDAILRGQSTTSIWKGWNKRGITTQHGNRWDGGTFRNMITRPSIAGIATYKGVELEGVTTEWPAIVPVDKWRAVQVIIRDPARKTSPGNQPRHLCSGVTFCGCGAPLRAGTNSIKSKRTGVPRRYTVYRCSTDQAGHSTILKDALDSRVVNEMIIALYRDRKRPMPEPSEADREAAAVLDAEIGTARAGLKRLADAIAADVLTIEDARVKSTELRSRIESLTTKRDKISRRVAETAANATEMEDFFGSLDLDGPIIPEVDDEKEFLRSAERMLLRRAMKEYGWSEAEAKAAPPLLDWWDSQTLEQQRALVRKHLRVTVRATGRGSRPADRIDVERL